MSKTITRAVKIALVYELVKTGALESMSAAELARKFPQLGDRTTAWRVLQDVQVLFDELPKARARVGL